MKHIIGITFFPIDSAMKGAAEFRLFGGWVVLFPPVRAFGKWQPCQGYWSPNATPWHHAARKLFGRGRVVDNSCVCSPECSQRRNSTETSR